ncbi:MAG: response regulator [Luteitalea sp.]|nr:response regulator [Luteitalea sp.]
MPNAVNSFNVPGHAESMLALIVDRDDDTRGMYAEFLRAAAWKVEQAADGREALAKAISLRPGIVITETRLPGINGFDLCGLLRQDTVTAGTPILVVTGDAYPADVERAHASGADAVLVKPCLPDRLAAEMCRVLSQSQEARQRAREAHETVTERLLHAEDALGRSRAITRKYNLKLTHKRGDTTTPPVTPLAFHCPACDSQLAYQRSHIGGVSVRHQEQWDYFACPAGCGTFQYRVRTRKLRKVL